MSQAVAPPAPVDPRVTRYAGGLFDASRVPLRPFEQALLDAAASTPWRELMAQVRTRELPRTPRQARAHARYIDDAEGRGARMLMMLMEAAERESRAHAEQQRVVLDLGVGFGAGLAALSSRFARVLGVEVDRARAIVAQARVNQLGLQDRVTLAVTDGRRLPFADAAVDAVVGVNVVEHLCDAIGAVLDEVARVLAPGGWFAADSRNRYDLAFPEPHVQLRGVGLLPRAWQTRYVTWRGVAHQPPTRLLSRGELLTLLSPRFSSVHIGLARPSGFGRSARWDAWVARLERARGLGRAAAAVYPSYLIVARR